MLKCGAQLIEQLLRMSQAGLRRPLQSRDRCRGPNKEHQGEGRDVDRPRTVAKVNLERG